MREALSDAAFMFAAPACVPDNVSTMSKALMPLRRLFMNVNIFILFFLVLDNEHNSLKQLTDSAKHLTTCPGPLTGPNPLTKSWIPLLATFGERSNQDITQYAWSCHHQ